MPKTINIAPSWSDALYMLGRTLPSMSTTGQSETANLMRDEGRRIDQFIERANKLAEAVDHVLEVCERDETGGLTLGEVEIAMLRDAYEEATSG